MTAAIYARKSNAQDDRAKEDKSVTAQINAAKAYAKTATDKDGKPLNLEIDDDLIFQDDGISGAEFEKRPGFINLMRAVRQKSRPPFQALIMSEPSRLGREQTQTSYLLQTIMAAGVRVFYCGSKREHVILNATDKILASVTAFANELEREMAGERVYNKHRDKAASGHVVGGRLYGYDHAPVLIGGQKAGVQRVVNKGEAEIVRRIFRLCAEGKSLKGIARNLIADQVPPPSARLKKRSLLNRNWSPSGLRAMLVNEHYRGVAIWNRTMKVPTPGGGPRRTVKVEEKNWIRKEGAVPAIVSEKEWAAAQNRLASSRKKFLRMMDGKLFGRPADGLESKYLLIGNAKCALCGHSFGVRSNSGKKPVFYYACTTNHDRGPKACSNSTRVRMADMDKDILAALQREILNPENVALAIKRYAEKRRQGKADRTAELADVKGQLTSAEQASAGLIQAIKTGGDIPALVSELKQADARIQHFKAKLAELDDRQDVDSLDVKRIEKALASDAQLTKWKELLSTKHIIQARQLLRLLFPGRLTITPLAGGKAGFSFTGEAAIGTVLDGTTGTANERSH